MPADNLNVENYEKWTAQELADYLKSNSGLGNYHEMILQHDVDGKVAAKLTENDLKEMGISSIGDRKRFHDAIGVMQKAARKKEREKVIWEADEVLWFSCWDACLGTCCGCCPDDPSHYTLTATHLSIKKIDPARCGPIRCCCGHQYEIDNVDLTHITDADVKRVAPPCCQHILCCGNYQDHVLIKTSSDGDKELHLAKGQGQPVSRNIMNQVEEAQVMERD